ncbi:hypothetical protein FNV43_RR03327 [Rhamnella rubrinervis]|uniref:Tetratricopeptide repeat protein 1 n=1 Tax=Rhamnella rubrinervis TaxID=2594499 RepID=A0A8K0HJN8_9ROSA|nr:hypothetical protein FNV43_RR03327 [Rhamnella rubrinervis]
MVLIELNETQEHDSIASKPSSSASTATDSAPKANGDADDGFETASDGELGCGDSDEESHHHSHQPQRHAQEEHQQEQQQQPQRQEQEQLRPQEEQIVSNDDDELKQRALAQANDAKSEGNNLYSKEQYEEALSKYEFALYLAPEMPSSVDLRSTCYSNRAICFLKLGKYEDTIKECTKALELNPSYMKALVRRAEAHEKLEHFDEAISDMKKITELDPSNDQARRAIRRLQPLAEEKREKMKEEMIGKLKEMGNSLLGRFGMSVDNFKAVKDPNTGSYSISFQQ